MLQVFICKARGAADGSNPDLDVSAFDLIIENNGMLSMTMLNVEKQY